MKQIALVLGLILILSVAAGCAKKTASEQLQADMKKAGNQLNKDANNLFK